MIYETNKSNKGYVLSTIIFIICILFGMLMSCKKDVEIKPLNIDTLCMGCTKHNKRDLVTNKIIKK